MDTLHVHSVHTAYSESNTPCSSDSWWWKGKHSHVQTVEKHPQMHIAGGSDGYTLYNVHSHCYGADWYTHPTRLRYCLWILNTRLLLVLHLAYVVQKSYKKMPESG